MTFSPTALLADFVREARQIGAAPLVAEGMEIQRASDTASALHAWIADGRVRWIGVLLIARGAR